jgi:hypothetical protein
MSKEKMNIYFTFYSFTVILLYHCSTCTCSSKQVKGLIFDLASEMDDIMPPPIFATGEKDDLGLNKGLKQPRLRSPDC